MATMLDAYRREQDLLPIVIEMESRGIPISKNIHSEYGKWKAEFEMGEQYLKSICGDVKVGSKKMYELFAEKGMLDPTKLTYTDKGNPRHGREFLPNIITDEVLLGVLLRRSKLEKVIGTYLRPWSESAVKNNFRVHPFFSQTRGDDDYGTRTGRFSSNLQQIPKEPENDMPNLRKMIVAEAGHVLVQRDYQAQEARVAAHFAEGNILQAFRDNPDMDAHEYVSKIITQSTGHKLKRKIIKIVNFLKLYGGGAPALSQQTDLTVEEARSVFSLYDTAIPEFKELSQSIERYVRSGNKIRTWGGRLYGVEPAREVNGRYREFYYKLLNVLVQGSSADMTKEAMLRYCYHTHRHPDSRIMLQVHDEIVLSCPENLAVEQMEVLKDAMDNMPGWDVPLRSDGSIGVNFGEMEEV